MTTSTLPPVTVDLSHVQRRTLELGLEAVEGKRDLSAILGDAFRELRAARTTIASLQEELQKKSAALAASAGGEGVGSPKTSPTEQSHPIPAEPAPGGRGASSLRLDVQVQALVADPPGSAATLFDGPLPDRPESLLSFLRSRIEGSVYVGTMQAGDRLPGIREIARRTSINHKVVRRAYRALEHESLVEVRDRSGIFVSGAARPRHRHLSETEQWVAGMLVESVGRGYGAEGLVALIRQLTHSRALRCACVDSAEDDRFALCREVEERFGMEAFPVPVGPEDLAAEIGEADLVVTTPFHANRVRDELRLRLDQPLVVVGLHPALRAALQESTDAERCTLMCVDPASGERLLQGLETARAARIRLVTPEEIARAGGLTEEERGIATRAARERLGGAALPAGIRVPPYLAPHTVHAIACLLIELNRAGSAG